MSQHTPLYDDHVRLGARMVDFHGWDLPVQYQGILAEHEHCREHACVFDTSHMGQILIRAQAAHIARVTTQNAVELMPGRGQYGFLLNDGGNILDDTILMRLDWDQYLLVVNAANAAADHEWLRRHLPPDAQTRLLSAEGWSKIDLQGPASARVLAPLADTDLSKLRYFGNVQARVCGQPCVLSRTGYTGELGYELFAPADSIATIFRQVLEHPDVRPAGLGARDSLRLEMAYPLYGADITAETNPFEAGLDTFITFDHFFVGATVLEKLAGGPPKHRLTAFVADSRERAAPGDEIHTEDGCVGTVTSAAFAPSLGVSIGMGQLLDVLATPGVQLVVKTQRADLPVTVVANPPYTHGTCRASVEL